MNEFYVSQLRSLLGAEMTEFERAYNEKPRHKAVRVNTLKIAPEEFLRVSKIAERKNPLCAQSFYSSVKPSLDPLYHAGLYYMQEPSACAAVAAFAPYIGERVLDLCAAPGGKSTQAAAVMNGLGVIFCNDVARERVRALRENIERLGIRNSVVTCASARDYRRAGFDGYFDTLMIDAPCSGGGMMRYETVPYSAEIVAGCAKRQREILDDAAELVARGGYVLYSTCTFSREENEDNVEYLAAKGFETVDIPLRDGETRGMGVRDARRIYPHRFDGEGHFYCVLRKTRGEPRSDMQNEHCKRATVKVGGAKLDCALVGGKHVLKDFELPRLAQNGARLNCVSVGVAVFDGAVADGISHALTHALTFDEVARVGAVELGALAERYIRGEQLDVSAPSGTAIATVNGFALGKVKSAADGAGTRVLKNLYPKSLRV